MKTALIILLIQIGVSAIVFGPRKVKDIQKKLNYENTYAIQNVETEKCLRPYNAENANKTKIISYSHHNWECLTWQMIGLGDNVYLLKNLYTHKSFQPSAELKSGTTLWQQTLGGRSLQYWEFIKQADETYLIKLKDAELYITATSDENDSEIVLMPKDNSKKQLWRLIRQNPIV